MFMPPPWPLIEPPPPPRDAPACARYAIRQKCATVDQVGIVREQEQDWANERRRKDWEVRFKVLGPRPEKDSN